MSGVRLMRTTASPPSTLRIAAVAMVVRMSRTPDIVADAAHLVFRQPAKSFTGRFLIDDSFLYETGGVTDFAAYSVAPGIPLAPDFFVPDEPPPPPGVTIATHLKLADLKP